MTLLSLRPLIEQDIPHILRYWFDQTDSELLQMGVERSKLTSEQEFAQYLKDICDTPLDKAQTYFLVWLIDNKPVGYNALKDIFHHELGHMHLHMWDPGHRGKGYGARLFCMAALEFYRLFNLKIILCEPRSSNPTPNKMLTKVGFKKWRTY